MVHRSLFSRLSRSSTSTSAFAEFFRPLSLDVSRLVVTTRVKMPLFLSVPPGHFQLLAHLDGVHEVIDSLSLTNADLERPGSCVDLVSKVANLVRAGPVFLGSWTAPNKLLFFNLRLCCIFRFCFRRHMR